MAAKKTKKRTAKKSRAKEPKTYVVIYHMTAAAAKRGEKMRKANPNSVAEGMNAWMAWAKKCGNKLVDMGAPLGKGVKVTQTGATPSKRGVAGYSVLKASSMAEAKALMKHHPHIGWDGGCEIEVHESMPLPGS